jgi:hypothetical protein
LDLTNKVKLGVFVFVALSHLNVGCKPALPTASPDFRDPKEIEAYILLAEKNYPKTRLVPTFVEASTKTDSAWKIVYTLESPPSKDRPSKLTRRRKLLDTKVTDGEPQPLAEEVNQVDSLDSSVDQNVEPNLIELTPIDGEQRKRPIMQPSAWIEVLCETPRRFDELQKMTAEQRQSHLSLILSKGLRLEDCEAVYISTIGNNTVVGLVGKNEVNGLVWSNRISDAYTFQGKNFGGTGRSEGKELVAWLANLELPEAKK